MRMLTVLLAVVLLLGLLCLPAAAAAPARLKAAFTLEHIPVDGTDGGPWASAEAAEIKNAKKAKWSIRKGKKYIALTAKKKKSVTRGSVLRY